MNRNHSRVLSLWRMMNAVIWRDDLSRLLCSPQQVKKHMNPHWIKRNTLLSSFALLMMLIPVSADDDGPRSSINGLDLYRQCTTATKKPCIQNIDEMASPIRCPARLMRSTTNIHRLRRNSIWGLRLFELDVFYDPKGGLYQDPFGRCLAFSRSILRRTTPAGPSGARL